jgi:hypothetical protein
VEKVDFKKELKHLYGASVKEPTIVDVPGMNFLMVDGFGDPNMQEFQEAIETLYAVSYALKFMIKKGEQAVDYGVLPLEGLFWVDDMSQFSEDNKEAWKWTLMIMQPEYVTEELFNRAVEEVSKKKNPPALPKLRFEGFHEGVTVQLMHIGPYSAEKQNIERLHRFIGEKGHELRGKHHEIYLTDPRRMSPEKMRTILRQPVK